MEDDDVLISESERRHFGAKGGRHRHLSMFYRGATYEQIQERNSGKLHVALCI